MQTETLSIRISKAESAALRRRAREEKTSRGKLVRRALANYGITTEPTPRSGYDIIKHLVGLSHGGPKDLSTNPKHLENYGR
jgi:hypothetical protein